MKYKNTGRCPVYLSEKQVLLLVELINESYEENLQWTAKYAELMNILQKDLDDRGYYE